MKQTHPFWKYVSYTLICFTTVTAVIFFFFWKSLSHDEHNAVISTFNNYFPYLIAIFFLSGCVLFFGLEYIFNEYIKPLKKISSEASIISTSNHSHRLDITGNKDIVQLSSVINGFAEILENMDRNITEQALAAS